MSWLSAIAALLRPAKELVEVLKPDAEDEAEPDYIGCVALTERDLAALQQFAAEFQARQGRSGWDSLVDGLNRLPRPLITLGILAFFMLALLAPVRFLEVAKAYQMMPDGFWALLSVIIAFYFGGRMQLKRQDRAFRCSALNIAREILAIRRAVQPPSQPAPQPHAATSLEVLAPSLPTGAPCSNRVVEAWRRRQMAQGEL